MSPISITIFGSSNPLSNAGAMNEMGKRQFSLTCHKIRQHSLVRSQNECQVNHLHRYFYKFLCKWFVFCCLCSIFILFLFSRSAKLPIRLYILPSVISYFFSPLGKPADRAIYFACVNFFLFSSVMIFRRQIISGSAWPIFTIFSPNERVFGADDRSGPLFLYLKGRCHGNRFCEKMANSALSSLWHSETVWGNAVYGQD